MPIAPMRFSVFLAAKLKSRQLEPIQMIMQIHNGVKSMLPMCSACLLNNQQVDPWSSRRCSIKER